MWGVTGSEHLAAHWIAVGVAVLVGVAAHRWVLAYEPTGRMDIDAYGIAMLAGGSTRVAHTAVAGLVSRGAVRVSRAHGVLPVEGAESADDYEAAVLRRLRVVPSVHV